MGKSKSILLIICFLSVILLLPIFDAAIALTEDFDDDVLGNNPTSIWYTYTESNPYGDSGVSDVFNHSGTQSMHYCGEQTIINFTFSSRAYTSFEFYYYNNEIGNANGGWVKLINGTTINSWFHIDKYILHENGIEAPLNYTMSIEADTWYRFHLDFNWTANTENLTIWNNTHNVSYGWRTMYGNGSSFDQDGFSKILFKDTGGHTEYVWLDDLALTVENQPPECTIYHPLNESTNIELNPTTNFTFNDPEGDNINFSVWQNVTESWEFEIMINGTSGNQNFDAIQLNASEFNTKYWWKIHWCHVNGSNSTTHVFHFTTRGNTAPTQNNEIPTNLSTNINISCVWLELNISDLESDTFNYTIECNGDIAQQNYSTNNTYGVTVIGPLSFDTEYDWYVNVSDEYGYWCNETYNFTTRGNTAPNTFVGEDVTNQSINVSLGTTHLCINISDQEGDYMNWSIETSPNIGSAYGDDYANSTVCATMGSLLSLTNYTWYVNVSDEYGYWHNETFWFVTEITPPSPPTPTEALREMLMMVCVAVFVIALFGLCAKMMEGWM